MKPKPVVRLYDLLEAYGRVHSRWVKGLEAMEKRQRELFGDG